MHFRRWILGRLRCFQGWGGEGMIKKGDAGINHSLIKDEDYSAWLKQLKNKVRLVQIKAVVKVNSELLQFYWELGQDIVYKQKNAKWGDGFLNQLSIDLSSEFPDMKGFSKRNLELIRQWYLFYSKEKPIAKQAVSQLIQVPWGHNISIISKCKNIDKALYYVQNTINYNWSRSVLVHQIESGLYEREGKSITNFKSTLSEPQSNLPVLSSQVNDRAI